MTQTAQKITAQDVERVMCSSFGSEIFYKRDYGKYMDYTQGVMNVQNELNMYWFVDVMYSHMPAVILDYKTSEDDEWFYVVELTVEDNHTAKFRIFKEDYSSGDYAEKDIAVQDIEYVDLPKCTMKFFLALANYEPLVFRLLCPSEH